MFESSIPRTKVAQVCVEALFLPNSRNKVVEIVAKSEAPQKSFEELFAAVI
jgi:hypothetical protein